MSDAPPPQYAAYPRGTTAYGSTAQLQALVDGYFGLNIPFVICLVVALVLRVAVVATHINLLYLIVPVLAAFVSYPSNQKIAFGKGWEPSRAILASVLLGLCYFICCGIIGFIVMQSTAANEIKKYGAQSGLFGIKKAEMQRLIAERAAADNAGSTGFNPPPVA